MKFKLTLLFLAVAALGYAQKKELKKVEKALDRENFSDAKAIFQSIDPNTVEDKYKVNYMFYKGVTMLGDPVSNSVSADELLQAAMVMQEAKENGYDDDNYQTYFNVATANIFAKAQEELKNNDIDSALRLVSFVSEQEPDNDKMRLNVANLAYKSGDFKTAATNYQALYDKGYTGQEESIVATEKETKKQVTFRSKKAADLAMLSGDYENLTTVKSDSEVGTIVSNLVWLLKNQDNKDQALLLFEDARSKYPNDASLKIAEADLYLTLDMQDEYEKAVKSLNEDITDPSVYDNLAIAAAGKENWDQAIDYYSKSLAINPDNYVAQNNLATAFINKGNLDETTVEEQEDFYTKATIHLEKVLELKPGEPSAKATLISLYNALGMTDKAAKLK